MVVLFQSLFACANAVGASDSAAFDADLAALEAAIDGYEGWEHPDVWPGVEPSATSHDAFTEVFFNDLALETFDAQAGGDMPVGAAIVKQSWKDEEATEKANLTAMYKVEEGRWTWASWDPAGEPLLSGEPDLCTGCHAGGQDSVLVGTW